MNYATDYTDKVIAGEIVAGAKIKQAARRYRRDMKASKRKKDPWPYYFNEEMANKAIQFCEMLPSRDGSPLKLEPFQKWLVSELFGWRDKNTNNRRYDRAYISMSRKNGKSFLMADLGALYLLMEDRPAMNREIVFTANSNQQAHLAFDMLASGLRQIARVSPSIRERLKINRDEVLDLTTNSKAVPLASDLHSLDGYQSDLAIIDEFALARSKEIYNVLKSGQINSDNSLLAVISTTGPDVNSPMHDEYKFVSKVLTNKEQADRYFIAIWEQDKKKEIENPTTWEKSNPLLSNTDRAKTMLPSLQADVDLAIKQDALAPLLVKNFNIWQEARHDGYITASDWEKGTVETPSLHGHDLYLGIDLSKSSDLTSLSWLVPYDGKLFANSYSFVGTKYGGIEEKSRRDGFDYLQGAERGECSITKLDSGMVDYSEVLTYILELIEANDFNLKAVCYDPWSFDYLLPEFEKRGMPQIEVRQGQRTLSIPTIRFREDLFNEKIVHADNQLLAYAVGNAILRYDTNNNPIIDKARNATKIDPIAALMNAYAIAMDHYNEKETEAADNEFYTSNRFGF